MNNSKRFIRSSIKLYACEQRSGENIRNVSHSRGGGAAAARCASCIMRRRRACEQRSSENDAAGSSPTRRTSTPCSGVQRPTCTHHDYIHQTTH